MDEEKAAAQRGDYQQSAELRSKKIRLEEEYGTERAQLIGDDGVKVEVKAEDIGNLITSWTGIPVNRLLETEAAKLLHMEDRLHERLIGQEEAVKAVSNAVRRARAGLSDPNRPIGSFIFLGPTGVGKTELARALAEYMFDDEQNMIRIDMSEYMEKHTASRLIGAPPGYVGYEESGQLTEAVRRRPFRVVLFDEIEKAHPDVFNTLLQILEDGRLTDGHGRTVDFKNTLIIMTSNLGTSDEDKESFGFLRESNGTNSAVRARSKIEDALKRTFRPEFLNRIDEIIIFDTLTEGQIQEIVELLIKEVEERLQSHKVKITLTSAAKNWLSQIGFDPIYGARPLRRAVQRYVENQLSTKIISGKFEAGDMVFIDVDENGLTYVKAPASVSTPTQQHPPLSTQT